MPQWVPVPRVVALPQGLSFCPSQGCAWGCCTQGNKAGLGAAFCSVSFCWAGSPDRDAAWPQNLEKLGMGRRGVRRGRAGCCHGARCRTEGTVGAIPPCLLGCCSAASGPALPYGLSEGLAWC